MEKINLTLKRFWEADTSGTEKISLMKDEDKIVLNKAEKSIVYDDVRYRISTRNKML